MQNTKGTLKRLNIFIFVLLSLITFGIYDFYWALTRFHDLNKIAVGKKISDSVKILLIVLFSGVFILVFAGEYRLVPIISSAYWVTKIYLAFEMRAVLRVSISPVVMSSDFFTFCFDMWYVQDHINQIIDAETYKELSNADSSDSVRPTDISLRGITGEYAGRQIPLNGDGLIMGRDPDHAGLVFASNSISRQHAQIKRAPGAGWAIIDMSSTNGTFIFSPAGWIRVNGMESISPGNKFRVGDAEFEIERA